MARKARVAPTLTERQQKWFASVAAGLERDTGKTLDEWVAIANACPETTPKKRAIWLKEKHGLGVNRAAQIFAAAFPDGPGWDEPDAMLDQLWTDKNARAIYEALAALVRKHWPDAVIGPRKTFVSFSRRVQFAAILPARDGGAELGLPVALDESARLSPMKKRPWAERHTAILALKSAKEVDGEVKRLIALAWEKG